MVVFDEILNLINDNVSLKMYFHLKQDETVKLANISDGDSENSATVQLLNEFRSVIEYKLRDLSDNSILGLSSADERINAVYKYDLEEKPELLIKMGEAQNANDDDLSTFTYRTDNFSNIKGIIIVVGTAEDSVVLYKQNYPISLLRRDKYSFAPALNHRSRLDKVDRDILKIDINFHFMLYNKEYYIFDLSKLEKMTGFDQLIKKEAEKGLIMIEKSGLLYDITPLKDELDDLTFARKLTRLHSDSRVLGTVENNQIIDFVRNSPHFRGKPIKITDNNEQLIVDTKVSKNALIKLLNDDYLYSELTKSRYESVAKNDVTED